MAQALGQQTVFDAIHALRGFPHNLHQHIGLATQQMHQQIHRRGEHLAALDRRPHRVHRAQGFQPGGNQGVRVGVYPQRRDVHGGAAKGKNHIVDHRQQRVAIQVLNPGGRRPFAQALVKRFWQIQVGAQPFFAAAVRQIQMQPDKPSISGLSFAQTLQQLCCRHFNPCRRRVKTKAINQPGLLGAVMGQLFRAAHGHPLRLTMGPACQKHMTK